MTGLFTDTDANATATLYALLRGMKAKVTRATVQAELPLHPDFPSLLSLSELLTDWKIENMALQLNTVEQLRELPLPFIAHLHKKNGWYVLVTKVASDTITYTDSHAGRRTTALTEFEKQWTGVVLLAETEEQSGEPAYETNHKQERLQVLRSPFLTVGACLLFLFVILSAAKEFTAPDWLLLLTKTIGLSLSGLLVAKQLGSRNALTNRLCHINSKTDCDGVLNSPAAKLWGWLSWVDVGLLYFAGGWLFLLTGSLSGPVLVDARPLLYGIALAALPYTVFSVYYQGRIVRQWCTLCLGVQGILLAEGILALTQIGPLPDAWQPYLVISIAFLLPTLLWVLMKPLLVNAGRSQWEHAELMRFKRNPDLFKAVLTQQPNMPSEPDNLRPVVLGNPDAAHTITMVTNPYCGPCAQAHKELEELLRRNANINASILFLGDGTDGPLTEVSLHALALAEEGNVGEALTNWYNQKEKNFAAWIARYPAKVNKSDLNEVLHGYNKWCRIAGIASTPTLFVDGYKLPETYSLSALRWLVEYLTTTALKTDLAKSR